MRGIPKLQSNKFPLLLSYAFIREGQWPDDTLEWLMKNPAVDLLIDSGAFSFHQTNTKVPLREYMDWIDKWKEYLWGYIAMDVPGEPKRTHRNLRVFWEKGYNPIPVHVMGDEQEWMDTLFEHSPLICVASLPIRERLSERNKSFLKMKMKWADGRPVHWLGYTDEGMIRTFTPYSVDSSSWTAVCRFGTATVYLGNGRRVVLRKPTVASKGLPEKYERDINKQLVRAGISNAKFMDTSEWRGWRKGNPALTISTYSWIQYVREIKERFDTRYFLSITRQLDCASIFPVLNRVYEQDYPVICPGRKSEAWT